MTARTEVTHIESRWQVVLVILAIFFLLILLPSRVRVFPTWFAYLLTIALIAPMVAVQLTTPKSLWLRIERIVLLFFLAFVGFGLVKSLWYLLYEMVRRSFEVTGIQLLTSSVAAWATNVLLFSLAYWRLDRRGPEARANHVNTRPDWLFPQQGALEYVPPDWHPTFVDYLCLAFNTATAFSPTDALPLTSRAKLLMMLESIISLVTIIVVAARAINILGS